MSVTAWLGKDDCGEAHTLAELVAGMRQHWCEGGDEEPQCFVLREGTSGEYLACMLRDQSDPEVCHTMYSDGEVEHHRCHYVLDADGHYMRTEVSYLDGTPCY